MISLKIFVLEGINKKNFIDVFKKHNELIDRIDALNYDLRSSTDNFLDLEDDLISFVFQHDFIYQTEMRGQMVKYPYFHKANFWVYFTNNKHYIFASGKEDAIGYILDEIKRVVADKITREIIINPLRIYKNVFTEILLKDASDISNSWFGEVDEDLRAAFLSGNLKDHDNENKFYKMFKNTAGKVNSTTFRSRKLGYHLSISIIKGSMYSPSNKANALNLIIYFKEVVYPLLNMT